MTLSPGEILSWATGISGVGISLFTLYGKGKESAWTQAEKIRAELQEQIDDMRTREEKKDLAFQDMQQRISGLELELNRSKTDMKTVLDFLQDVIGGQFDAGWMQRRAKDLLDRMKP